MRQRIRSHLTYANIVATLSLFLVLGGGTALAAYVVSSNSQVGPGTISGHKPPSGKHANIIPGRSTAPTLPTTRSPHRSSVRSRSSQSTPRRPVPPRSSRLADSPCTISAASTAPRSSTSRH